MIASEARSCRGRSVTLSIESIWRPTSDRRAVEVADLAGGRASYDRQVTIWIGIAAVAAVITVVAVRLVAIVARRGRRRAAPDASRRLWEGIRLESAVVEPAGTFEVFGEVGRKGRPRLVIRGEYMARPSIYRAASSDWAFASQPTPIVVLFDATRGVEIHRASLHRIHGEYQAIVQGLSISHALPPPLPPSSPLEDKTRREGAPFAVDIGFYIEPRDEPWELRVHAELGPLRSDPIAIAVPAASAPPR
jgi:hypothetical protein